jgi:carboxyl-terminal processing protease
VVREPAEGAPSFDPSKPETDHQLQQALVVLRGMVAAPRGAQP